MGDSFSGSGITGLIGSWKSIKTQSMILIIRWGGFANFLTVAISAGLIVWKIIKVYLKLEYYKLME